MSNKFNVYFVSLGCPKNQVDAEVMLTKLLSNDKFELVNSYGKAQILIINTCSFIDKAKEESVNTILEYINKWKKKSHEKFLFVTGCLVSRYNEELGELLPEVDGWLSTGELKKIEVLVNDILKNKTHKLILSDSPSSYLPQKNEHKLINNFSQKYSAYIKIADGCNNKCSYCVIPSIRGPYKSRTIKSVYDEASNLINSGVKEINLIAQDTTNYGIDIYKNRALPKLMESLLKIKESYWLRLLYVYPERITDELIDLMKSDDRICKYLDMPIQHIDNDILKSMKRQSTEKSIRKTIEKLKTNIPDIALRTSLIVGFPGETKKQFNNLVSFVKDAQFDYVGVFTYSREEGTDAYSMPKQIKQDIKEERQVQLLNIQEAIASKKNANRIGKIYKGLAESNSQKKLKGRLEFQAPEIDGEVIFDKGKAPLGSFVKAKVVDAIGYNVYAEIVNFEKGKNDTRK